MLVPTSSFDEDPAPVPVTHLSELSSSIPGSHHLTSPTHLHTCSHFPISFAVYRIYWPVSIQSLPCCLMCLLLSVPAFISACLPVCLSVCLSVCLNPCLLFGLLPICLIPNWISCLLLPACLLLTSASILNLYLPGLWILLLGPTLVILSPYNFRQYSYLYRQQLTFHSRNCNPKHFLRFYFQLFSECTYSDGALGSERCQSTGDLYSILCLNASCLDTDRGLKLLLLLCLHVASTMREV